jgi:hypothetical protein
VRGRCAVHELEQDVRWVYADARWQPARIACFVARRVPLQLRLPRSVTRLHAHHVPKLRMLLALGRDPFDVDFLETKCGPCHSRLTTAGE